MPEPYIVIIILNFNHCQDVLACLASLELTTYPDYSVLVLDVASKDGSVEAIRAHFPHVQVIELMENLGYAGNNNIGIRKALEMGADWLFLLNEDTQLAPDCLSQLISAAATDSRIGIAGPMVYHADEPDVIQSAGGKLVPPFDAVHVANNERDIRQISSPRRVEWVTGCGILVKRGLIEQAGLLDERFFCYWEETDWCLRASKLGWEILHVPDAKMWHKGVQRNYHPDPAVTYYVTRNRFLVMEKNRASFGLRLAVWWQIARRILSWTIRPKWRRMHLHRDAALQGALDYLRRRWGRMPVGSSTHQLRFR